MLNINDGAKIRIILTIVSVTAIITSFGFEVHPNLSGALPCADTLSFVGNYPRANIHLFDSFAAKQSIRLYWVTGVGSGPPYLYFKEVRVFISSTDPDSEFCELLRRDKGGSDSTLIEGLIEGEAYFLRVATYDSAGQLNSLSGPIMTIPGEPEQSSLSISAPQRESPLYYSGLAWSADSKHMAFLKTIDNSVNITNLDLSTISAVQATNYLGTDYRLLGLDWSPDSKWISYCYTSSSIAIGIDYRIWLVLPDGGTPFSVTSGRVDASAGWISPTSILFTKGTVGPPNIPEFYTVDLANGNQEKQLTSDQVILKYSPSINLSRKLVAFYGSTGTVPSIYTMSLLGSTIEPIAKNKYWSDIHPFWSANGQHILFTSSRSGHYEIWSIDVDSKQIQQITRSQKRGVGRFYGRPSPSGKQLAVLEIGNIFKDAIINIISTNTLGVEEDTRQLPSSFLLHQNYPNPFNPSTTIQYAITRTDFVTLKVYDVLGREMKALVNERQDAGNHTITFDAGVLPSGVYFYRLQTAMYSDTKKLLLLK